MRARSFALSDSERERKKGYSTEKKKRSIFTRKSPCSIQCELNSVQTLCGSLRFLETKEQEEKEEEKKKIIAEQNVIKKNEYKGEKLKLEIFFSVFGKLFYLLIGL